MCGRPKKRASLWITACFWVFFFFWTLTDYFAPLRLRSPFGKVFGEPVSCPERADRHAVLGQLVGGTGRRAAGEAPARSDRDERAHQQSADGGIVVVTLHGERDYTYCDDVRACRRPGQRACRSYGGLKFTNRRRLRRTAAVATAARRDTAAPTC